MPRAAFVLVTLALLAVPAAAELPSGLDKIVPPDALVYVAADGVGALEASVNDVLADLLPGAGGALTGGFLASVPGLTEVSRSRPIAFWVLPSGTRVMALPVADPAALAARLAGARLPQPVAVIAGRGYSLVTSGAPVDLEDLRSHGTAAPPALAGNVRGFVSLAALEARYGAEIAGRMGTPAAAQMGKEIAATLPRLDFAITASRAGVDLVVSATPERPGVLSALAHTRVPPGPNRFLAAMPGDAMVIGTAHTTSELIAANEMWWSAVPFLGPKQQRLLARARRQTRAWSRLTRGDSAFAWTATTDPAKFAMVQAYACRDQRRVRFLIRKLWRRGHALQAERPVTTEFHAAAWTLDGIEVDEQVVRFAGSTKDPAAATHLYDEPIRYAYPPGAVVTTFGPGGREQLEHAVAGLRAATGPGALAAALPAGSIFAVAWDLHGLMPSQTGPPATGADVGSIAVTPQGGTLELKIHVPASALRQALAARAAAASALQAR
jgi:hypothetical protein